MLETTSWTHAQTTGESAHGHGARVALLAVILSATVFQRFALNFGSYQCSATFLSMYAFLIVAGWSGLLLISAPRLAAYGCGLGIATLSLVINSSFAKADYTSFGSMMLLATMYLPHLFVLSERSDQSGTWALSTYSNVALFCAIAGIVQFYAQFVIHADWLFDFSPYLPEVLRGPQGFNTVIPVGSFFKSNGFFFQEPSGFCFAMALALMVEWELKRRIPRLVCFGFALLLTYSGTGILALILGLLFPLGLKTVLRFLGLGTVGLLVFFLLGDALNLTVQLERSGEVQSDRSSGYIRYIAPGRRLSEIFSSDAWTPFVGHGPGTIWTDKPLYDYHDPTWAKLLIEYGVLGFLAFVTLMILILWNSSTPTRVRAAMFFSWLAMGGHLLSPENNFMLLALVGLHPRSRWAADPRATDRARPDPLGHNEQILSS
jgi:hypothetical protein